MQSLGGGLTLGLEVLVYIGVVLVSKSEFHHSLVNSDIGSTLLEGGTTILGSLDGKTEILMEELDHEATVVALGGGGSFSVVGDGGVGVDNETLSGGDGVYITEHVGASSEFLSNSEGLRKGNHVRSEDEVVGKLGSEALTGGSTVEDVLSHSVEDGSGTLNGLIFSSAHEGKSSVKGSHNTTGHGGINESHANGVGSVNQKLGSSGEDSGGVKDEGALGSRLEDTTGSAHSLSDMGSGGDSRYDEITVVDGFGNGVDDLETFSSGRVTGTFEDIESSDGESVLLKVESHGLSHVSDSDESDLLLSGSGAEAGFREVAEHCFYLI